MTRVRSRGHIRRFRAFPRILLAGGSALLLAGCPSPEASDSASGDAAGDSVTQRERFEALEDAGVPGAGGLTGAVDASDAAAAAAAARDSILRGQ